MDSTDTSGLFYRETTERFWILELITEVRTDGLHIRLAPIHRSFRHISSSEIANVTVTTYSPSTYGGWHWGARMSLTGNTVYRLYSNRGVEITVDDGRTIFVGSQSPEELETALKETTAAVK